MELQGLERLLAKGLTQEEEALARRYYSDSERQGMDESDFCGPHRSFPVKSAADVSNAAHLIGHADDSEAVKACIIRKAKANGWALPDAWKEDDKQDRALTASDRLTMSLPLVRIDAAKREVWGQATAEVPDSYGTIFGYCPDAWRSWRGNIREQHDPKKAVGKAIEIEPDEQERAIYVGSRVSRGAPDTWLKVEDNVLTGYSASIIPDPEFGPDPRKWPKKTYNGKEYPFLPRYTVAELSLVDNAACPGCDIQIVRADGFATDVLDTTEEETPNTIPSSSPSVLDRAGARLSSDSRAALHEMRDKAMSLCGCEECAGMQTSGEPDGDADMERKITGMIERAITAQLSPVYARLQGIAGTLARSNASPNTTNIESIVSGAITRAVEAVAVKTETSLSEVRADLSAVKETVVRIDNTPMPGAPIMNASATRPPINKQLPTDPFQSPQRSGSSVYDAIARMSAEGMLDTPQRQADAVAAGLMAMRNGGG